MAINIIDILKSQISGQIAGQLGKQLGESESTTKSGIEAMIPTILGGLLKQVSAPGGADKLDKTLTEGGFDGGLLDNITGMLTGGKTGSATSNGGDLVSMLFGDKTAMIAPILAKLTGMKTSTITAALAILVPLVMSFLGKQKKTLGLDANGLASLLTSQKDAIGASLPAGISDAMGLGALGIAGPTSASKSAAKTTAQSPVASSGGGIPKFLIPLAILAAVGYGCYTYIFSGIKPSGPAGNVIIRAGESTTTPQQDVEMARSAAAIAAENGNLQSGLGLPAIAEGSDLTSIIGSLSGALGKVTDVESAKAALPNLEDMNKKLAGVSSGFSAMPEMIRGKLTESMKTMMPDLQATIDKVLAIPGVKEILQPIIDKLMEKVKTLTV